MGTSESPSRYLPIPVIPHQALSHSLSNHIGIFPIPSECLSKEVFDPPLTRVMNDPSYMIQVYLWHNELWSMYKGDTFLQECCQ